MAEFLWLIIGILAFWQLNKLFGKRVEQAECPHRDLFHLKDGLGRTRALWCPDCEVELRGDA